MRRVGATGWGLYTKRPSTARASVRVSKQGPDGSHLVMRARVLQQVVVAHHGGPEQRAPTLGRHQQRRLQVGEARLATLFHL